MATGRVLQFDQARGYGFVAADDGGEDVFIHASVFEGDPDVLTPGRKVQFNVMAGDRGRKAFAAHLVDDESAAKSMQALVVRPAPLAIPPQVPSRAPALEADSAEIPDEEQMCDVLSQAEFGQELTELLLSSISTLTSRQILDVRQCLLECARKHGWVDI